jgi:predicted transcriptional regulator
MNLTSKAEETPSIASTLRGTSVTAEELAELLGISQMAVSRWVNEGKITPTIVVVDRRKQRLFSWDVLLHVLRTAIVYGVFEPWSRAKLPGPPCGSKKPKVAPACPQGRQKPVRVSLYSNSRIASALEVSGGSRTKAAKLLGIGRKTIHRRLAKHPELDPRKMNSRKASPATPVDARLSDAKSTQTIA